jgi:diadenylate cyclase
VFWRMKIFVLEDYIAEYAGSEVDEVKMQLRNLSKDHLMDLVSICRVLGYQCNSSSLDGGVSPRGYRILNKVPRLPGTVVRNMVNRFNGFQGILGASLETLDDVEGIGEVRAKAIRDGIKKIHEQIIWENLRK